VDATPIEPASFVHPADPRCLGLAELRQETGHSSSNTVALFPDLNLTFHSVPVPAPGNTLS
jgi:hypothetical protein